MIPRLLPCLLALSLWACSSQLDLGADHPAAGAGGLAGGGSGGGASGGQAGESGAGGLAGQGGAGGLAAGGAGMSGSSTSGGQAGQAGQAGASGAPGSWKKRQVASGFDVLDMQFFDAQRGMFGVFSATLGNRGVFFTQDGGVTWKHSSLDEPILALSSRSGGQTAWALVKNSQSLWRSSDSAQSFVPVVSAPLFLEGSQMHFWDDTTGIRCEYSYVRRTTDGGSSWKSTTLEAYLLHGLGLWQDEVWLAATGVDNVHGALFTTSDRGESWTTVNLPSGVSEPYGLGVVTPRSHLDVWTAGAGARVLHSPDGGKSWTPFDVPVADTDQVVGIAFDGPHGMLALNAGSTTSGSRVEVFESFDDGDSWQPTYQTKGTALGALFAGPGVAYVHGLSGLLLEYSTH